MSAGFRELSQQPLVRSWSGASLLSFSGVFVRLADVEASRSAFLRNLYALPFFMLLIWRVQRRGGKRWRSVVILPIVLVGMLEGAEVLAYHVAVGMVGAGLATALVNLQVVLVGIAGAIVFGERPRRGFWLTLPLVLTGVWLVSVTGQPIAEEISMALGVAIGLLSAALYASYLVMLRMVRLRYSDVDTVTTMASATMGIMLVVGLAALVDGTAAPAATWDANAWLIALALGTPIFGWLLIASSIHLLPSALTSISLLLQPTLALVWGVVLLDEPLGWLQLTGAGLVLLGVGLAHQTLRAAETA